ncbi:PhzF family phenazine biosynthesis protein [Sphingobium subterraneum]|uniref:PhzF family phenazine biosynthesis protein n=1 Tax=Sphingobium subterraneum TaxID=627688 RepID=A0A841IYF4_9SPHN|nr:PhzF family phenazine biosynthesis protein [Sphingobium subterraneum]
MVEPRCDLIDVFLSDPLTGNPLAVVHGADGLSDADMLRLTRWLGFSETTFLLPPTDPAADYRVRIFYPAGELPFAGHPTLGTCHAWIEAGGQPHHQDRIVQQCGVGLVDIRRDEDMLWFKAPPLLRDGPLHPDETAVAAKLLNIPTDRIVDAVHADNGPGWILLRLAHVDDVLGASIVHKPDGMADIGLFAPYDGAGEADFEVRAFFTSPSGMLMEDPVTGSLNAALAQYAFANGLADGRYTACQGRGVGRAGRVHCKQDDDASIWIGGSTATVARHALLAPLG